MQLDETKTYRTRDGSRTGIRVVKLNEPDFTHPWQEVGGQFMYNDAGQRFSDYGPSLIEENPASAPEPRPFSYDACPMHGDGRRRAVTRDGREVVLLSDRGPNEKPVVGVLRMNENEELLYQWRADGRLYIDSEGWDTRTDLLVPLPPKRVVWVNLYDGPEPERAVAIGYANEDVANVSALANRLGNRAYRIEID